MDAKVRINGKNAILRGKEDERLRDVLYREGYTTVRDSDDGEGFAGSDTIILDDKLVYSNLLMLYQVDGREIRTAECLSSAGKINDVQEAMVKAGVVQSAYNAPEAALALTWLLEHNPNPTKEDIKNALSGIFIRDAGYEHYYMAVDMVKEKRSKGSIEEDAAPSYRENLMYIGKPTGKIDGEALVAGDRLFVEDKVPPHTYAMHVLRSPFAHAFVKSIDTSEAMKIEGVEEIFTAFNTPDIPYMQAGQGFPEPSPYDRVLINKKVRHVGDRVAAIVAVDMETAMKAAELIKVEYETLDAVFTVEEAMADGAPLVHNGKVEYASGAPADLDEYNKDADEREEKVIYQFPLHGDIKKNIAASAHGGIGDIEKGFAESDAIVDATYQTSQVQCTPLEPHVCYAHVEGGRLVINASTQVPYHVRRIVAKVCSLPENKVHVIKERVGGGYGSKQDILVEDLVGYASWKTGKPIYYRNTRAEEFYANSTRHPMRIRVKMGGKKDGTITAIYMDVRANTGPYGNHCLTVPMNASSKTLPLFRVDNMYYDLITYYTNIPPTGAYQGYGAPKGFFAIISAMGELAMKLGLDPLKVAEKNIVEEGYMLEILKGLGEGREGAVVPVGSCGLRQALERGAELIGWGKKAVSDDPEWKIGKGFAMIQQGSGLPGLDHSNAQVKLLTDGTILVLSGGADLGTGLDTISAKIAAEILKVPLSVVSVVSGDTDSCLFDTGAYASSGTYFSGNASLNAAKDLLKKMLHEASLQMGEKEEDLSVEYPGFIISKSGKKLSYFQLSHDATAGDGRGQLIGTGSFTTPNFAVPYGAHFAEVAVNVKTGEIKVRKFIAVQDAGTPINPELALCQMYGAAMKSIGHTLYEDMVLDKDGKCLTTTFTDYGVPMIEEAPEVFKAELVDVNDQYGPFGAKSISEIACNGAAPAIAMAIADATGVWVRSWPITGEKILKGLGKF
ncbi:MAG: molybdopterin-dependent oxidoreductase Mo/Fe-S-binding subunit [Spirochaetes bacterium]|uniref:Molybdopterin-dependent oxidoreductase Mo/Fe-S-binding subunit n=1 Tax=Candidatus Ornithospirochaeta stercoripullorum TaxID=2840899 RepID=A0A9D9DYM2_9SPIO|nr:molybdopterin-dependent oxidoreductase Mo/Fe-S-binding subunit [Candidatus Ornithospirochaeta stercoripullorum]